MQNLGNIVHGNQEWLFNGESFLHLKLTKKHVAHETKQHGRKEAACSWRSVVTHNPALVQLYVFRINNL